MPGSDNQWVGTAIVVVLGLFLFGLWIANRPKDNSEGGVGGGRRSRSNAADDANELTPTPGSRAPWFGTMPEGFNGVAYRLGKISRRLITPGLYLRLPLIYKIVYVSVQDVAIDLPLQNVPIESGASVGMKRSLIARVTNPRLVLSQSFDYITTVRELALQVGYEECIGLPLEQLAAPDDKHSAVLLHNLNLVLEEYGVKAIRFAASDYILSDSLKDDVEQVIQARLDAEAAVIEEQMASVLLAAAEKYVAGGSTLTKGEVALRLRELSTYKDLKAPSLLVSTTRS